MTWCSIYKAGVTLSGVTCSYGTIMDRVHTTAVSLYFLHYNIIGDDVVVTNVANQNIGIEGQETQTLDQVARDTWIPTMNVAH
jgi:hypothetical protein